ncbi:MAG: uncharacterized membrane protein (UPF0127 family) [Arenicella sp.]|jgi:uncharacterized membrane protein (UPF0127 family)
MSQKKNEQRLLFSNLVKVEKYFERLKGLITKSSISERDAYWFNNCSSIHMFGMSFSIDVIFLSKELQVVKLVENLKPWRVALSTKAKSILEVKSGQCEALGLRVGDQLNFSEAGVLYAHR